MPTALSMMGCCLTSGDLAAKSIYLVGGYRGTEGCVNWTQIFDPYNGVWSSGAPLPAPPRGEVSLVNVNDKLYALGGENGNNDLVLLNEEYTPADYESATPSPTETIAPSPSPTIEPSASPTQTVLPSPSPSVPEFPTLIALIIIVTASMLTASLKRKRSQQT